MRVAGSGGPHHVGPPPRGSPGIQSQGPAVLLESTETGSPSSDGLFLNPPPWFILFMIEANQPVKSQNSELETARAGIITPRASKCTNYQQQIEGTIVAGSIFYRRPPPPPPWKPPPPPWPPPPPPWKPPPPPWKPPPPP